MKTALFRGRTVNAEAFCAIVAEANPTDGPFCPECKRPVHLYGRSSVLVETRFDHPRGVEDCSLSRRSDRDLVFHDDKAQAMAARQAALSPLNFIQIYRACVAMCGPGCLDPGGYEILVRHADREGVWFLRNSGVWCVPFSLLTLGVFHKATPKGGYDFCFLIRKTRAMRGGGDRPRQLVKVFADSLDADEKPRPVCTPDGKPVAWEISEYAFRNRVMRYQPVAEELESLEEVRCGLL